MKFQPSLHAGPKQPLVLFPVMRSVIFPEASLTVLAPAVNFSFRTELKNSFIVSDLFLTGGFNKKKNACIPQNLNEALKFRFQPCLMQRKKGN